MIKTTDIHPDAAIIPVMRKVSGTRTTRAFLVRRDRGRLEASMPTWMLDAERELETGFNLIAGHLTYPHDLDRVRGQNMPELSEQEWRQFLIENFQLWKKTCPMNLADLILDHLTFAKTLSQIAQDRHLTRSGVQMRYMQGLNVYGLQRGFIASLDGQK